jgi:hypothetical protein
MPAFKKVHRHRQVVIIICQIDIIELLVNAIKGVNNSPEIINLVKQSVLAGKYVAECVIS